MLGREDEADAMSGIFKKLLTCREGLQDALLPFSSQVLGDTAPLCNEAHETFGLVCVELVGDEDPLFCRMGGGGVFDMGEKVLFRPGIPDGRSDHFSRRDFQVPDEALGAMTDVLELPALNKAGLHGERGMETFERLDARLLIDAHHMRSVLRE